MVFVDLPKVNINRYGQRWDLNPSRLIRIPVSLTITPQTITRMLYGFSRLLAPLTDISILVEAAHQPQFPCLRLSRKAGYVVNGE